MLKLSTIALVAGLLAASACNSNKTGREAERAAELVNDKTKEVKEEAKDLTDTAIDDKRDKAADVAEDTRDMTKAVKDHDEALGEFAYHKTLRIQTLRAVHAISASQANVMATLNAAFPFIDEDRTRVNEKLTLFKSRIDDSARLVQGLEAVEAAEWVTREHAAADAMNRLEDARSDTWAALEDAKTVDGRTSMR